jgi:hypothetical protein
LHPQPDTVGGAFNAAFHDMSHSESIRNLAQIAFHPWFVFHHRAAADDFQIRDLGQVIPDFSLNTHRKERLLWISAQTFERQNGNAPFCNSTDRRVIAEPNSKPNDYRKQDAHGYEGSGAFQ